MPLTPEIIVAFIRKHATGASIQRSQNYYPLPDYQHDETARQAHFVCQGSGKRIYQQTICFDENRIQSATCTCPSHGRGICKHAVAALRALVHSLYMQKQIKKADLK